MLVWLIICRVLEALTRKFRLDNNVSLKTIAQRCPVNYTGADMYALCADAWQQAVKEEVRKHLWLAFKLYLCIVFFLLYQRKSWRFPERCVFLDLAFLLNIFSHLPGFNVRGHKR